MIPRAVEQRPAAVVRQIAELHQVRPKVGERLQDARQLAQRTVLRDVPVRHVDAVRHVQKCQADGQLCRSGEGRRHRIQER